MIKVAESPDMNRDYAVAGDGAVDLALMGRVVVDGLSTDEAAEAIERALEAKFFKKATVSVEISQAVEGNILVLGAVERPGTISFSGDKIMTVLEALVQSGGMNKSAAGHEVRVLRWKAGGGMDRQVLTVDVQGMMDSLDFSKDQYLRPRDIIFVPSLGGGAAGQSEFLAMGQVGSPGFHPCSEGLDVIRAVGQIGGINQGAKMDGARLLRPQTNGSFKIIPLDLARLFGAADVSANVPILPGDIFFVPSSDQSAGGKIYLMGQVAKQGFMPIALDAETTLARVLLGSGVTKFANTSKVKILRKAPDGTRQSLVVDVQTILDSGDFEKDVPLRDEDVIVVPEKMFGL